MRLKNIADKTLPPNGRVCSKQFWDLLKDSPDRKEFLKLYNKHKLDLRATYYLFTLKGIRPRCKTCGEYTAYYFRNHIPRFSTYCCSKCANQDPDKIKTIASSLRKVCKLEKEYVKNLLQIYKNIPILDRELTKKELKIFKNIIEPLGGQPREYDILKQLSQDFQELWATFPANSARGRLEIATGIRTLASLKCIRCGKPIKEQSFGFGTKSYCSTKCSTINTALIRITPESKEKYKKTIARNKITILDDISGKTLHDLHIENSKKAQKEKFLTKHGSSNYGTFHSKRARIGFFNKYGVLNPSQVPEIRQKQLLSGVKNKHFILGNKEVVVQGFEPLALNYLINKGINPNDIKVESSGEVPSIDYFYEIERVYYPDIYIPRKNLIIEVKSCHTLCSNKKVWEINLTKFKAVKEAGYKFSLLVMKKGNEKIPLPRGWHKFTYKQINNWIKCYVFS